MSPATKLALAAATILCLSASVHGDTSCHQCSWNRESSPSYDCLDAENLGQSQTCSDPNDVCFTTFLLDTDDVPVRVVRGCESNSTCRTGSDELEGNKTCCDQNGCNDHTVPYEFGLDCYDCVNTVGTEQPACRSPPSVPGPNLTRTCLKNQQCETIVLRDYYGGSITKVVRGCKTFCYPVQSSTKTIECCDSKDLCNGTPDVDVGGGASTAAYGGATLVAMLVIARLL